MCSVTNDSPAAPVPDDFPQFQVPGHEEALGTLRDLYWHHYKGAAPKATMWDEWLAPASLWPACSTNAEMRRNWAHALSTRGMDPEGYVHTHQHSSIAHQHGWPFPFWNQGRRGFGYHFSFRNTAGPNWRPEWIAKTEFWKLEGVNDGGMEEDGWTLNLVQPNATLELPPFTANAYESPFVQVRWKAAGMEQSQPYIEWKPSKDDEWSIERRFYFDAPSTPTVSYMMLPIFRHPKWSGNINHVRIGFGNAEPGSTVCLQAIFAQYDTRHNINNLAFIQGCTNYFWFTRDLTFLRDQLPRIRTALQYVLTEFRTREEKVIRTTWIGHEGRSGVRPARDGKPKEIFTGEGVGSNYWDLLPFGNKDCYATLRLYDVLHRMARLEDELAANAAWNMPNTLTKFNSSDLRKHAEEVKTESNRIFWNAETGRFVAAIDADGKSHDYGLTFLNCEAIYYDVATEEHAKSIMDWLDGRRTVKGDTSQTTDIYKWRFGPRATTLRNIEYYGWYWNLPESIPFGSQVQDGGGVLGFSFHDLMSRVKILGPDNAWKRLQEITVWYREVEKAGGYRKYYDGSREGGLQGGGTPGGLGLDQEFFESALVPQVMTEGFLGFRPFGTGFQIKPSLPAEWPELTINNISYHHDTLSIKVTPTLIDIQRKGPPRDEPVTVDLPSAAWAHKWMGDSQTSSSIEAVSGKPGSFNVVWGSHTGLSFQKK